MKLARFLFPFLVLLVGFAPRTLAQPPVANDDEYFYEWEGTLVVNLLFNDSFNIGTAHYLSIGNSIFNVTNGIFNYNFGPLPTACGDYVFGYRLVNLAGESDSATVTFHVPAKARPDLAYTLENQAVTLNVLQNDAACEPYTLSLCSQAANGTLSELNADGSITYTPANFFSGTDSFCYTLCTVSLGMDTCFSVAASIIVEDIAPIWIPEGFSPDGDGINDVLMIRSAEFFPAARFIVLNRYGSEVWRNEGEGYTNNFAGNFGTTNQPLPDGTYFYTFAPNDGLNKTLQGSFFIQR